MEIRFKDVPSDWAVCFNNDCPLKEECMRYQVGLVMPDDVWVWRTVMAAAWKKGDCKAFAKKRTERMAYGLSHFFDRVEKQDYSRLRDQAMAYLGGHSNYYRYNRGEKLLSEAQQQYLLQMMAKAGYEGKGEFGSYVDVLQYDWTVSKTSTPF